MPARSNGTLGGFIPRLESPFVKRLLLFLLLIAPAIPAYAWGEAGHYIANDAATRGLPNDMPHFFYRAYPELIWLGYDPDRWKRGGESIDGASSPDHFLDYEFVAGLDLPRDRNKFLALLESSGRLRRHGITNSKSGFVIWRIAELCEVLTTQFRLWRSSAPGSSERVFYERSIINTAGNLGHYVADAANPHHATMNYNGWAMTNPNGYATDCDTHARFESVFVAHSIEIGDVVPKLSAPRLRTDYFATALDFIRESNALVEKQYQIDRRGGFDIFRSPVSREGFEFATDRLAAGGSLLRDLWWSAWQNSAKPRRRD